MTKKEILEFLELPDGVSDADIFSRLEDKLLYFQRLSENAPNDFLKKLHIANIQKVNSIKSLIGAPAAPAYPTAPPVAPTRTSIQMNHGMHQTTGGNTSPDLVLAWLIRHTKNQSTKPFSLKEGLNYIGRNMQAGPSIVIDNDPYVSRAHAIVEVERANPVRVSVYDTALVGKPSKNGVYVNARPDRITQRIYLNDGDTIQVGTTKMILKVGDSNINNIVKQVDESEYMKTVVIDIF